jgi:hypothetical protein
LCELQEHGLHEIECLGATFCTGIHVVAFILQLIVAWPPATNSSSVVDPDLSATRNVAPLPIIARFHVCNFMVYFLKLHLPVSP